jgi:hypothetical protein
MAYKKTTKRKVAYPEQTLKAVQVLTRKARKELAQLLAQERAGTITRRSLDTGLKCVAQELKTISFFQHKL